MTNQPSISLEAGQFQQALTILNRERPSPLEERWFLWLNRLVWTGLFWTGVWPIVLFSYPGRQIVPLSIASVSYIGVVVLFLLNLKLVGKLWRAARTENRLGISSEINALTTNVSARNGWASKSYSFALMSLFPLGLVLTPIGVVAVPLELIRPSTSDHLSQVVAIVCLGVGLACLSLYPMHRRKQRLEAVAKVQATLLENDAGEKAEAVLSPAAYDLVTSYLRTQITLDREESIAASRSRSGRAGSVRLSPLFQESLSDVVPGELSRVYAALRELSESPSSAHGPAAPSGVQPSMWAIAATSLAIEFTLDLDDGEIVVNALRIVAHGATVEVAAPNEDGRQ